VRTPFQVYFLQDRVGTPINWVLTAVGRAYLAHCPEREREKILARLRKSDNPENWLSRETSRMDRILAETKARGYGLRDINFAGGAYGRPIHDLLCGIAVPLTDQGRVHGVINIVWAKAARSIEDMAADHLDDLQSAARDIVSSLRKHAGKA
jgi:IclR family mhp operon transcriptional activator